MPEQVTVKTSATTRTRLLDEIDRMRQGLAHRFVQSTSVTERFAISRELGQLLERKRRLVLLMTLHDSAATG